MLHINCHHPDQMRTGVRQRCRASKDELVQGAFGVRGAALIGKDCEKVGKEQERCEGRGARV